MVAVAVIGIGCKFPGGIEDADTFWEFVLNKGDAVTDIPADRWDVDKYYDPDPDAPGRMYTRRASFLTHRYQQFDTDFFGISRREAVVLDPQQRLLLEVAWEALDDAGMAGKVAGANIGAYIGSFTNDNAVSRATTRALERINNFAAFSASQTLLANRISYTFNMTGPSMSIDTACSSSLVATHLAVRAIEGGECDVAIAGGSSIMFTPETFVTMCKGRFLAADGRSKSFEADADGYGRGEGVGVVVLKNLEHALRDGDRVYAVIRGSGINQDGRTLALPVPNPESQQQLAERVIKEAGIDPAHVGYVEAHGTGTGVGDPLEMSALGNAYSLTEGRTAPLVVGSVKNNFGHTEAAAGVAGLIKAALTVQRRTIAPQAYFDNPNPEIAFDSLRVRIPTEVEPYPDLGRPALAAVNSFGYGGTNAHVLVEQAPEPVENRTPARDSIRIFPVSARSNSALHDIARDYARLLESDLSDENAQRLKTAVTGRRAHHFLRKGLVYRDAGDLLEQLTAFAASDDKAPQRTLVEGISDPVFVFSGMGPQWWAMGRALLERSDIFRSAADEIDAVFEGISGWSVVAELLRSEEDSRVTQTAIAQPANFVIQAALVKYLEQFGVRPVAVVGHSVGEITSAYVSGALSLHDAATVAFHRSRVQAKTAGTGGMLAIGLSEEDARQRIQRYMGLISVAAINGGAMVTLAGDQDALDMLREELAGEGVFARPLQVEVPYHSHLMDPILDELGTALSGLTPQAAEIPLYSTVTGAQLSGEEFADPAYWQKNVRQPVMFAAAIDTLIGDRYRAFLEVGPHPVISGNIREAFIRHSVTGAAIPTLHREKDAEDAMLESVAELYAAGSIDIPGEADLYRDGLIEHMDLPKYPWIREELWEEAEVTQRDRYGDADRYALLGDRANDLTSEWGLTLAPANLPWLRDHVVAGAVLLPGTAYIDAALSAVRQRGGREQAALDSVSFMAPLVVAEHDVPITRLTVDESTGRFTFNGRSAHAELWTKHAQGRLVESNLGSLEIDIPAASDDDLAFGAEEIYAGLEAVGLSYGPTFQRIRSARITGSMCIAQLASPESHDGEPTWPYTVHPALSDAALQCVAVLLAMRPDLLTAPVAHIPVGVDRVRLYHDIPEDPLAVVEVVSAHPLRANAYLVGADGDVALAMMGVTLQPVGAAPDPLDELERCFYELKWEAVDDESEEPQALPVARAANVVVEVGDVAASVADGVRSVVTSDVAVTRLDAGESPDHMAEVLDQTLRRDSFLRLVIAFGANNSPEENLFQFISVAKALTTVLDSEDRAEQEGLSAPAPDVQVVVVTQNAFVAPGDQDLDLGHAVLVGARRTLANEQEKAQWFSVDLGTSTTPAEVATQISAAGTTTALEEVVIRDGKRWTQRLRKSLSELTEVWEKPARAANPDVAYEVQLPKSRLFKDLALRECDRAELGPREVEVRIEAIGLNFKDALKVLGILTERELEGTYFGTTPGMETASMISRVGSEVHEVAVGDRMMAVDRHALGRYVTAT